MKKNILLTVALLLIIAVIATTYLLSQMTEDERPVPQVSPTSPPLDSLIEDIKRDFSEKYDKAIEDVEITIEVSSGDYAKGSVRFKDEYGGAIWFGARQNDRWILASDGQGPMPCETADKFSFPQELVPQCIDEDTGDLVKR